MSTAAEPRRAADTQWLERPPDVPSLGLEDAVRTGLTSPGNKSLPSQFFYDAEGSRLFEAICDLGANAALDRRVSDLAALREKVFEEAEYVGRDDQTSVRIYR